MAQKFMQHKKKHENFHGNFERKIEGKNKMPMCTYERWDENRERLGCSQHIFILLGRS